MRGRCGCGGAAPTPRETPVALRSAAREHVGRRCRRLARRRPRLVWFYDLIGFFDVNVWMADAAVAQPDEARPADRRPGRCASRLDHDQAAHGVDGRRQDLSRRHTAGNEARRRSWPAAAISPCCSSPARGGRCKASSGAPDQLVLSILDNLQPVFEVLTPSDGEWTRARLDRPAGNRRGQRLVARCRKLGEQRRSVRHRPGSADAAVADADRQGSRAPSCSSGRRRPFRRTGWW